MNSLIFTFVVFCMLLALNEAEKLTSPKPSSLLEGSFYTKVDHFRPHDHRKAKFYYQINLSHYRAGGPLFIFMNDALTGNDHRWVERGLIVDIAQEVGGAVLTFDHRYTGRNIPTDTASFSDLEYLTTEQSLADLATLIVTVKRHLGTVSPKVHVWGSGYGGTLATQAKNLYPHLIHATWASSSPIYYQPISTIYITYLALTPLQAGIYDCYDYLYDVFNYFKEIVQQEDGGQRLQEYFDLCEPVNLTSTYDRALFFQLQVQFLSDHLADYHMFGLQSLCRNLQAIPSDPFQSYVRWVRFEYGANLNTCRDLNYDNHILLNRQSEWNQSGTSSGSRQMYYRQCTQVGLFHATYDFTIFPNEIPSEYFIESCNRIFGEDYTFDRLETVISRKQRLHGVFNMPMNKMIFTNGYLDPLRDRGMTYSFIPADVDAYIININYASRSSDLDSITGWDPQLLVEAKQRVRSILLNWINE